MRYKHARQIKCGVVGYGARFNIAHLHLREMKRTGMTLTAVCEQDPERLDVASAEFPGIETYTSLSTMLRRSDVNLVTIVTPHNTHAKLALQCLRAGRHVICEKPMAVTTSECDRMIDAARQRRVMLSTFHNRHWDGCVLEAVKRIRAGAIGEVHRVRANLVAYDKPGDWWRSSKSVSGGILYDWGVHFLEYALQIIDSSIVEVSGFDRRGVWASKTPWKSDTNEDEATAVVRFRSGAWLALTVSSIDASPPSLWFTIHGTKGVYSFDGNRWESVTVSRGVKTTKEGRNQRDRGDRYYTNVRDYLVGAKPLAIMPQWARRPIHILDLADRSAKQGVALKAKYG